MQSFGYVKAGGTYNNSWDLKVIQLLETTFTLNLTYIHRISFTILKIPTRNQF
jgi:hypothetical protein